jgi:hypothetical protein
METRTLAPTLALSPAEELSMLYKALPEALLAASTSRSEELKLANIVSRIKEIGRGGYSASAARATRSSSAS